jgi:hypothetical protein
MITLQILRFLMLSMTGIAVYLLTYNHFLQQNMSEGLTICFALATASVGFIFIDYLASSIIGDIYE